MKQQCNISFIYSTLLILAGGIVFFLIKGLYLEFIFWVLLIPLSLRIYTRYFPLISNCMGYGTMDDEPAIKQLDPTPVNVVLYTGLGCPFCAIIRNRLKELQPRMEFKLKEVDITLRPDIVISKGIHSLPVIEVGKVRLAGNATSEQLVNFIKEASISRAVTA